MHNFCHNSVPVKVFLPAIMKVTSISGDESVGTLVLRYFSSYTSMPNLYKVRSADIFATLKPLVATHKQSINKNLVYNPISFNSISIIS